MWETPQLLKSEPIHYSSVIWFWYLTKIDFFSFFPALLLWKEIKQKQIPIVIWKWMSHCSRDSKCIHTQCVHLIIIISNPEQFSQSSLKYFEWFIILKSVSNTRFFLFVCLTEEILRITARLQTREFGQAPILLQVTVGF